jgi:hypothetical protein
MELDKTITTPSSFLFFVYFEPYLPSLVAQEGSAFFNLESKDN